VDRAARTSLMRDRPDDICDRGFFILQPPACLPPPFLTLTGDRATGARAVGTGDGHRGRAPAMKAAR